MAEKPIPRQRDDFSYFQTITTRWKDNDVYGHVNNVEYYSYFDTAVNQYLIENGCLDIQSSPSIGLVVDTSCSYFKEISFPEKIEVGLRVSKIGTSSVTYEVAIFKSNHSSAAAQGRFVHVYVDRENRKPTPIPKEITDHLSKLL
ncbi:MAG: thioesterase family protein [Alphaproteobacteria bacterium]|nr:thioesterase family protein [Alphaproteobacteria bacterium]